jgi:hypothetical protein
VGVVFLQYALAQHPYPAVEQQIRAALTQNGIR